MKKRVGLFFGGMSNEHEVSISSAVNVARNMDRAKYDLVLIFWGKDGCFYLASSIEKSNPDKKIYPEDFNKYFNVAFPVTHGKYGEDGILQAILEKEKIPYVGCHVLSSALCMDKAIFKDLLAGHGIQQVRYTYVDFNLHDKSEQSARMKQASIFSLPLFVKPANSGSSVGITKVDNFANLDQAIKTAKEHDSKVIIEEGLTNHRELEVAILGNDQLELSPPGEIIVAGEFYDYDEKYKLGRTKTIIPAKLTSREGAEMKQIAEKVYRLCGCSGFARVDFFLKKGIVYLSEINTLPGFTDISMYPMLMQETGISYKELISRIIELAY
ncbi:MAG: hypothetical protein A2750_00225 [Candidatus Yanofskybacteria bacterium RIFCSPHIGHO2_01_FULL_45_42]|uniref:D-alanine--D-alanine ligase n=3 Tax=Candidatus Yanofskyibacteriota TaxID=1752733 RepID=A0A1F8F3Z4_9BACT|nr:MAG: hypothetical protein A2750_00225 [Candidatus Yanofskybacteria bacterium RIFCSPHIGHO2_01_FULL_45_42]OGN15849.1 MAG: hypothetical protein A3C81_02020 [Candidatus Yanofskybacteria bacterium RIFCSPHIGHO2_02_FULL_46_19]OGN27426.1 MAG: hypothetical protein A3B17_01475 [Candidatus Yanofskybacteria bacterium RIFCSPLOWO2_01_FULL_45_72]OGN32287.1 MAG: hypothetical protein A3J01_02385 [Candidatus Yanofskybacteria bacterium RIFCSPLOWO2_02_FULL_45_18]